jgi:hypothetical protein
MMMMMDCLKALNTLPYQQFRIQQEVYHLFHALLTSFALCSILFGSLCYRTMRRGRLLTQPATTNTHRKNQSQTVFFTQYSYQNIINVHKTHRIRDSAVGTATVYGLEGRGFGVRVPVWSRIINCKVYRRNTSWPFSRHCSRICLRGLRKTTNLFRIIRYSGRDSKAAHSEY